MRYSLRQMQIFRMVARELSYTRAAELLHLTQPACFAQVRQLEDNLGHKLVDRIGKTLFLTQAGEIALQTAERLLEEVDNLEMALAELQGLARGRLRLAAVSTAKYDIPALIGRFNKAYPGIELSLTIGNREELLERFARNADDLYVLGTPPSEIGAEVLKFAENPVVVIVPPEHELAKGPAPSLADVARFPLLVRERGSGTRLAVERAFADAGVHPATTIELGANEAVKQGVIEGLGIAALSRGTVALELRHGYLTELAVPPFPIMRFWHVVWPAEKRPSLAAKAFLDLLNRSEQAIRTGLQET